MAAVDPTLVEAMAATAWDADDGSADADLTTEAIDDDTSQGINAASVSKIGKGGSPHGDVLRCEFDGFADLAVGDTISLWATSLHATGTFAMLAYTTSTAVTTTSKITVSASVGENVFTITSGFKTALNDIGSDKFAVRFTEDLGISGDFQITEVDADLTTGGGGQNIAVGQVTENDTANAFVVAPGGVSVAFGQVTETNTAQAFVVAAVIAIAFGQVTEIDAAQAFAAVPGNTSITIAQITETDTANAFTVAAGNVNVVFGQITETDIAQAFTVSQGIAVAVAQVVETDTANPFTVAPGGVNIAFGQITETDTANPFTASQGAVIAVNQVTETDTAQPFAVAAAIAIAVAQVTETDIANPFAGVPGNVNIPVAQVTETDIANPFAVAPGGVNVAFAQVTENDTANPFTLSQGAVIAFAQVTETDTANPFAVVPGTVSIPIAQAIEADTANPFAIATQIAIAFNQITETDTANPFTISQASIIVFGQVIEADTANPFTVIGGGGVPVADKMADSRTPGRDTRRKLRAKHPAWREMEIRLQREYEVSQIQPGALEDDESVDYLTELIDQHDQVQEDLAALEDRLSELEASRLADNAIQEDIEKDIEKAQHYLILVQAREIAQARLIAAFKAVILYYYY